MNAYLVVYLCILISKAIVNTVMKYVWQADPNRDEPWYNERTETERQRHIVSLLITVPHAGKRSSSSMLCLLIHSHFALLFLLPR